MMKYPAWIYIFFILISCKEVEKKQVSSELKVVSPSISQPIKKDTKSAAQKALQGHFSILRADGSPGGSNVNIDSNGQISGAKVYSRYTLINDSIYVFYRKYGKIKDTFFIENRGGQFYLFKFSSEPKFTRSKDPHFILKR